MPARALISGGEGMRVGSEGGAAWALGVNSNSPLRSAIELVRDKEETMERNMATLSEQMD
jgi:hypothetical protein